MLSGPLTSSTDRTQYEISSSRTSQANTGIVASRSFRSPEVTAEPSLAEHRENDHFAVGTTSSKPAISSRTQNLQAQLQQDRGVLVESNRNLMTPTGLVSTPAPSLPPNWYELAIKARTATLRESQHKMSTPSSVASEAASEGQTAPISNQDGGPVRADALEAPKMPVPAPEISLVPKAEPVVEPLALTHAPLATEASSEPPSQALAGGLVSSPGPNYEPSAVQETAPASSVIDQPVVAALSTKSDGHSAPDGDPLRTEIMGPPPSLPADFGYPPLNPVASDMPAPAPVAKRRGPAAAVNGTQRKTAPLQAPADFVPPTNINGKMPFALFQTVKKAAPADPAQAITDADRSRSQSTSGDAVVPPKEGDAPIDALITAESGAVDPLLADVLTDADSVATATVTRETSPDATLVLESSAQVAPEASSAPLSSAPNKAPSTAVEASIASVADAVGLTPAEAAAAMEVDDASSPAVALRRNPSNRGASLQASQSITSAYADPLGLKKHRESLLQQDSRGRRSPSASSTGAAPATQNQSTSSAGGKKSNAAARTIVPPSLVEPPPGMMHTPEGRLRTIPGIAGAIVPPGPNSTSTDTNLTPRLEDKGAANNDFCETCGGHGRFVCCDGCPRSFHFHCMSPPLDIDEMPPSNAAEVLGPAKASSMQKGKGKVGVAGSSAEANVDEMWFCNVCVAERKPKAASRPKGLGPFGYLLPVLSQHNPKSFQLPADVRTYFKDVATAVDGDYVNGGMLRQVKPNRHGQIETRDPYRLKDKNGDGVLCYRCGGTALPAGSEQASGKVFGSRKAGANKARSIDVFGEVAASTPAEHTVREGTGWRKIVSCDFCPLHWHIDCVDPPMLGMPSNLRKWMCPAHSDHVNDRRRIARIGAAVPKTLDLPLPSAKTIGPGKHFRTRVLNNGDIDIIPDPMEELMGANGITGSLQSGVKEVPVVPGVLDSPAITEGGSRLASKIRYRFPEKVIRTDFWSKLRADESSKIGDVFYVAAGEVAGRAPVRLIAVEDGPIAEEDTRFRPFGKRHDAHSGLDALADIATLRLKVDDLVSGRNANSSFKTPSRTRQLIATAFGIDLTNDDVPESNVRSSLSDDGSSAESPLSSLSESDGEVAEAAVAAAAPAVDEAVASAAAAVSEEEMIKRIAMEAATGVSSGDPIRLSKRKAAVAAESAIAGSPSTPAAKKLRSASPAVTPTPSRTIAAAPPTVTVPIEVRPASSVKKITLKSNGSTSKAGSLSESQLALRTAYHLSEQYVEERREIEQLRAIRELMKVKGPARMLEFLLAPNDDDDVEREGKVSGSG
ncbi:Transcriptional regulatory protein RCO1 [Pseudozyma hubeiensis]|nr:Transcriptional regulatory protein RCO1 [Pseudozyma hubeiensis]